MMAGRDCIAAVICYFPLWARQRPEWNSNVNLLFLFLQYLHEPCCTTSSDLV